MALSRKDYELIAGALHTVVTRYERQLTLESNIGPVMYKEANIQALNEGRWAIWQVVAEIADALDSDNIRFNRDKFWNAIGFGKLSLTDAQVQRV
jgi:hypothetical protein